MWPGDFVRWRRRGSVYEGLGYSWDGTSSAAKRKASKHDASTEGLKAVTGCICTWRRAARRVPCIDAFLALCPVPG